MVTKEFRILSETQLKKLKDHRYSCTSTSFLDPLLQPWWNWLVQRVPFWLAPNLITILGLIVNIITSLILVYYSPDCKQQVPRWACYLCALGLFIYQSLDAIDGKQARRTNSSSPLGELFDHGCDSISTVFVSIAVCVSCQLGHSPPLMFLQSFCAVTLFYCAHWQTYVSGTLRFGKIDVTEAQVAIMIIHCVSGTLGCEFWSKTGFLSFQLGAAVTFLALPLGIWSLIGTLNVIFTGGVGKNGSTVALHANIGLPIYMVYVGIFLSGAIRAIIAAFYTILYEGAGKNGSSVAGTSVLSPIIPFSLVLVPAIMIACKSDGNIYEKNPALYVITFGLIAAKVTNRLVVAHMTKSEMDYLDIALLGPFLMFMNQYFNSYVPEGYLLWLSAIWAVVELWRYCSKVCQEICESLDIYLFKIGSTSPKQPDVFLPCQKTSWKPWKSLILLCVLVVVDINPSVIIFLKWATVFHRLTKHDFNRMSGNGNTINNGCESKSKLKQD
ncbi:unnamed protein product [Allacma fusca]|uniref:diacylglycerol cholinephosphotransferase n=1 Tax=Allacma fusca TaxID=39272 RepID=A0A8J2JG18_9HEXA|nr:unnamed protein product [Allacma fusca]